MLLRHYDVRFNILSPAHVFSTAPKAGISGTFCESLNADRQCSLSHALPELRVSPWRFIYTRNPPRAYASTVTPCRHLSCHPEGHSKGEGHVQMVLLVHTNCYSFWPRRSPLSTTDPHRAPDLEDSWARSAALLRASGAKERRLTQEPRPAGSRLPSPRLTWRHQRLLTSMMINEALTVLWGWYCYCLY